MARLCCHQQRLRVARILDHVVNDVAEELRSTHPVCAPACIRTEREDAFASSDPEGVRHFESIAARVNGRQIWLCCDAVPAVATLPGPNPRNRHRWHPRTA